MIYVFSYWCDDQAAKQTLAVNWKAIFGLLTFVKSTAEKAGMSIIVGLWCAPLHLFLGISLTDHLNSEQLARRGVHAAPHLPPRPKVGHLPRLADHAPTLAGAADHFAPRRVRQVATLAASRTLPALAAPGHVAHAVVGRAQVVFQVRL